MRIPTDAVVAACRALVAAGSGVDQSSWSCDRIERFEAARSIVSLVDENAGLRFENLVLSVTVAVVSLVAMWLL